VSQSGDLSLGFRESLNAKKIKKIVPLKTSLDHPRNPREININLFGKVLGVRGNQLARP